MKQSIRLIACLAAATALALAAPIAEAKGKGKPHTTKQAPKPKTTKAPKGT